MKYSKLNTREYLVKKGITFWETDGELRIHCIFSGCDKDSKGNEAHLYLDAETGQYHCKKCDAKGNLITLAKQLGDSTDDLVIGPQNSSKTAESTNLKFGVELVEECHQALPDRVKEYLNQRGISDSIINQYKLGYGCFYGKHWITIPIKNIDGKYEFFKLRQDPLEGDQKTTYPSGVKAQLYDQGTLENARDALVICEGELDALLLLSRNIQAVTSTHGAMTFNKEWIGLIAKDMKVYICYDNDTAGRKGADRVAKMIAEAGNRSVYKIELPQEVGDGGDITDYLLELNGSIDDLFGKLAREYPEKIDTSNFTPLSPEELDQILDLTIKKDSMNKLLTFLGELSAYTEDDQLNLSYNAPSSTGKSYIPIEVSQLFPEEDVIEIGYCTPTAFFHEQGEYVEETNSYVVDLSHKILLFLDQPCNELLARLRPLLSHDRKEIKHKITDRTQKSGLRTKNVVMIGYPAVIFCTAGLKIDEQETTRFLLLSPEMSQEKISQGIYEAIKKQSDTKNYVTEIESNQERKHLKERIRAIKQENVKEIIVGPDLQQEISKRFLGGKKALQPRHNRDIKRVIALIKLLALLNLWWREKNDSKIYASNEDVDQAFKIWGEISKSQELGISPYIYDIFTKVICPAWLEKKNIITNDLCESASVPGLTRKEILYRYHMVYGKYLDVHHLRHQILPMLETAGLIIQEPDPIDRRQKLIVPIMKSINGKEIV